MNKFIKLQKIYRHILIFFMWAPLQASWLIPTAERDLMNNHALSRVQAKNYLDLQYAASQGRTNQMKNILNRQEPITPFMIDIADENGNTLLHTTFNQHLHNLEEIIKILVKAGANINAQNNDGDTILHFAINNFNENKTDENLNILRYLLDPNETDTDINILNKNHESPLSLNPEIIHLIVLEQNQKNHDEALKQHAAGLQRLNKLNATENYEV